MLNGRSHRSTTVRPADPEPGIPRLAPGIRPTERAASRVAVAAKVTTCREDAAPLQPGSTETISRTRRPRRLSSLGCTEGDKAGSVKFRAGGVAFDIKNVPIVMLKPHRPHNLR